jgi:hypothetical protein
MPCSNLQREKVEEFILMGARKIPPKKPGGYFTKQMSWSCSCEIICSLYIFPSYQIKSKMSRERLFYFELGKNNQKPFPHLFFRTDFVLL